MGRTTCTEPQCLSKGALYLYLWSWKNRAIPLLPLWAVRPVQSLSACTRVHLIFFFFLPMNIEANWQEVALLLQGWFWFHLLKINGRPSSVPAGGGHEKTSWTFEVDLVKWTLPYWLEASGHIFRPRVQNGTGTCMVTYRHHTSKGSHDMPELASLLGC